MTENGALYNIATPILEGYGLSLQKQNSSNESCILLLWSLEALNPELVNFTWIREGQGSLYSSTSYDMNSSLHLRKPDWSDGDTIICRADYSNTRTPLSMNITLDFSNKDADSIRAVKGATVHLPCHSLSDDSEQVSVEWIHRATNKTICQWTFNNKMTESSTGQCIPHVTLNRTSLRIENVQISDSGIYSCKTTRLIPPPTLEHISDLTLHVEGLSLQKQNSSNESCILLLCSLEALNPELVNFTWIREGQGSLYRSTSYDMNSSLHLCKPDWSDGDTIICRADYSNTQTQTHIILTSEDGSHKALDNRQTIVLYSVSAGLVPCIILCIIPIVVVCKRRKRDENGSTVFSNKVYENYSFATARQNTQAIDKPQPEECIYEN
ncbi:uncharacterized protein LOC143750728 [Siphateles boraxobius]|uniref:uncharacterized protein LOC143750728 n=1 Tax=Siphateles boraxobius TaxID=180520 RepID=UPI004064A5BF